LQRETAMLLHNKTLWERVWMTFFSATDALSAIGGVDTLNKQFGIYPDVISGVCSGSPLHVRELQQSVSAPVFNAQKASVEEIMNLIINK